MSPAHGGAVPPPEADADELAAGGVVWRVGAAGVEVALVHRPRYQDWSLPKGKCRRGEHPVLAAGREAAEETGQAVRLGRGLATVSYPLPEDPHSPARDGRTKTVHYFSLPALGRHHDGGEEVDEVRWLAPAAAAELVSRPSDAEVLARFATTREPTRTVLLVRHGSAGDRGRWTGCDQDRPLDAIGHAQAARLVPVALAYGVRWVGSADPLRCRQTVAPLAARLGIEVRDLPELAEATGEAAAALAVLRSCPAPAAVCSQGGLIPQMLTLLTGRPQPARKGSVWVLSFAEGPDSGLVGADYLPDLGSSRVRLAVLAPPPG